MPIKVDAKDEDTLKEELEEWSIGVNLFSTSTPNNVTFSTENIKEDHTKRTTYENETLKDD